MRASQFGIATNFVYLTPLLLFSTIFLRYTHAADVKPPCIKLISTDILQVNHFTGSGDVELQLHSDATASVDLGLTAVLPANAPTSIRIRFSEKKNEEGSPSYPKESVLPQTNLTVWMHVSELITDGTYDIELRNHYGKEVIGKVHVVRSPLAINLQDSKLVLDLSNQDKTSIVVRNDGPVAYPSNWVITNGFDICGGHAEFKPMVSSLLYCSPASYPEVTPDQSLGQQPPVKSGALNWLCGQIQEIRAFLNCTLGSLTDGKAWLDAIKPDVLHDGYRLILYPDPPESSRNVNAVKPVTNTIEPITIFSGQGSLHYWPPFRRTLVRYVVLFGLLLAGGLLSNFLSYFIPNRLLLQSAIEELHSVDVRNLDLTSKLDSKMLTNVRLQQSRLTKSLKSRKPSSPEFADMIAGFRTGLGLLSRRISVLQQIQAIFALLETSQAHRLPPTMIDDALNELEKVKGTLSKLEISDSDLTGAEASVAAASSKISPPDKIPTDFGDKLKDSLANSVKSFEMTPQGAGSAYEFVQGNIGSLMASIKKYAGKDRIDQPELAAASFLAEKAKIIATYIALRDAAFPPQSVTPPLTALAGSVQQMQSRLNAYSTELFSLLQTFSLDGLRSAKLLIREMTEDIYPARILKAIEDYDENNPEFEINADPPRPHENSPLELRVRFFDSRLDNCAAREEFRVTWDFGDKQEGEGWSIYHYYRRRPKGFWTRLWFNKSTTEVSSSSEHDRKVLYTVNVTAKIQRIEEIGKRGDEAASRPLVDVAKGKKLEIASAPAASTTGRARVEHLKFGLTITVAAVALIAGAETQLGKLDFIPGLIAVFFTGFTADSMKRLVSDSPHQSN